MNTTTKKTKRVLIIDDEPDIRKVLKRVFEMDREYEFEDIKLASTVEEGKEILKEASEKTKRLDVVIIDWRFDPDKKDGGLEVLEALNEIKEYRPKIKIVYTAYPTIRNCVKAMKAGADNYIDKNESDSCEELLKAVKEELEHWRGDDNAPEQEWFFEHTDELYEKYRGEWLAFIDGIFVDHAITRRLLKDKVKEKYPDEEPYIIHAPVRFSNV